MLACLTRLIAANPSDRNTALPPIVLIPGLYGTQLFYHTDKNDYKNPHWYCPTANGESKQFWADLTLAIPPRINCLFELLTPTLNPKNTISDVPGLKVTALPDGAEFGDVESIDHVDKDILPIHFIESLGPMLDFFLDKGYKVQKNLFAVAYDWRLTMPAAHNYFPDMKKLVERAFSQNDNTKVTILGYSLGSYMTYEFLKEMDDVWKEKYIKKVLFLAPAIAGAGMAIDIVWNTYFPILPFLKLDAIKDCIPKLPVIHSLFPNHIAWGNKTIIKGPDGISYSAKDVPGLLKLYGKFQVPQSEDILKLSQPFFGQKLTNEHFKVPLYIIYNSAIKTAEGISFPNGFKEESTFLYGNGDGTVPEYGIQWLINNFIPHKKVLFHDLKNSDEKEFSHGGMSTNSYVHKIIYDHLISDDWTLGNAKERIVAPHVTIQREIPDNYSSKSFFTIHNDIRPEEIIPLL